jgi:hypothetical protein
MLLKNINSIENFVLDKKNLQYTELVLRNGERADCDLLLYLSFNIRLEINEYPSQDTQSKLDHMKAPNPIAP